MRLCLIVPGFSADQNDWCIPALRDLARSLAANDDLTVVSVRYPYRRARYTVDGVPVFALGGAERRGLPTIDLWRETLRLVRTLHRERPFDVLHAFWATESGLLGALAGRALGVPVVVSVAGGELVALDDLGYGDQRSAWERVKVGASLRLATAITGGSRYVLGLIGRRTRRRRFRAPLGVDVERFHLGDLPRMPERLVHVGALTPVKDHPNLLRAVALLRMPRPRVRLDLIGSGRSQTMLARLASELGLADVVRFRADVSHGCLAPEYQSACALVSSSRHEAQGMVVLEAAACGTPTVGSAVGIVPELAPAAARCVAPADPHGLAASLEELLSAPEQLEALGRAARERAAREFALGPCTERFRAIYATLARA